LLSSNKNLYIEASNVIVNGNMIPNNNEMYSLGTADKMWSELWVSSGTIHIGPTATIGANASGSLVTSSITMSTLSLASANSAVQMKYTGLPGTELVTVDSTGKENSVASQGYVDSMVSANKPLYRTGVIDNTNLFSTSTNSIIPISMLNPVVGASQDGRYMLIVDANKQFVITSNYGGTFTTKNTIT
jgi:hypothetical protein